MQNHKGNNQGSLPQTKPPRRKRIGRQMNGQPKLFGGSLEEYLEATNQEIPLIVKSCVRVINLYGKESFKLISRSGQASVLRWRRELKKLLWPRKILSALGTDFLRLHRLCEPQFSAWASHLVLPDIFGALENSSLRHCLSKSFFLMFY